MDQHLHMLTAYIDSKFTAARQRKLLVFGILVTVTVGFIRMINALRLDL
jgi:hypothetical protein